MELIDTVKAFSLFKPEQVVFVISVDSNGKPGGMVAAWSVKTNYHPPMYGVALNKKGYTHKLVSESGEFVIAVPNSGLEDAVKYFGEKHGDQVDKFKETQIEIFPSKFLKTPLIKEATINFECKLIKEVDLEGDYIFYLGEVLATHINKDKGILMLMGKDDEGNRIYKEFPLYSTN